MAQRGKTNIDAMRDEAPPSFMNSFIAGLKTEFTGMNFPPNAATDCDNVIFTMLGDVTRREGFDIEDNGVLQTLDSRANGAAVSTYVWRNAGGDGDSQVMVVQIATTLYFWSITSATVTSPLSAQLLSANVDMTQFAVAGPNRSAEATYADGNGYLFVYSNACNPFYCIYDPIAKTITAASIDVKIRDFMGMPEPGVDTTYRPGTLTAEHQYNLQNQGWTRAPLWSVNSTDSQFSYDGIPQSYTGNGYVGVGLATGNHSYSVGPGLPVTVGTPVDINYSGRCNVYDISAVEWGIQYYSGVAHGIVISYDGQTLVVNITSCDAVLHATNLEFNQPQGPANVTISSSTSIDTIDTWYTELGTYPANADIWWIFKDQTDTFNPQVTVGDKGLPTAWAPKGHYILEAFNQDPSTASGVAGLQTVITSKRPTIGTWFQGRVWYSGVDDSQAALTDQNYYTWTENIYFSRIIEGVDDFGKCYEDNDPTDQYSFNLLPSDGGVITIQGAGTIFKLFPVQNGMLVFAANGVWFITGSQGIGFAANDYTITKISSIRSISPRSFVDVQGVPMFWNEEGIYMVAPAQQGLGLQVEPMTVGTIKSYYDTIPIDAKKGAVGAYNPIDYVVQWLFKDAASINEQTTVVTNTTGTGLAYSGYTVLPGHNTGNYQFKSDTFGNFNYRLESINPVQTWTINGNTYNSFGSSLIYYIYSLLGLHIIPNGDVVVRGSGDGSNSHNAFYVFDNTGNLLNTVADTLATVVWNVSTTMTDYNGTVVGMTNNGSHGYTQFFSFKPLTDTTLTNLSVYPDNYSNSNQLVAGPLYAYTQNTNFVTTGVDPGYLKVRRIQWGDGSFAVVDVDFTSAIPQGIANVVVDNVNNDVLIIATDGTIYKYSADLTTQLSVSATGLLGTTKTDQNDSKRMLQNGVLHIMNQTVGANPIWNIYTVDPVALTITSTWYSTDTNNGYSIAPSADTTNGFTFVKWNDQQQGYFLVTQNGYWDFWPVPRVGSTFSYTVSADYYQYNKCLSYNTHTTAWYPWSITDVQSTGNASTPAVNGINYIIDPGGILGPPAMFKYVTSVWNPTTGAYKYSFADVTDTTYVDWDYADEVHGTSYNSYFMTGFDMSGQGLRRFQPNYVSVYCRNPASQYSIQGIWDYASAANSGRWSTKQNASFTQDPNLFSMVHKRHRIRGHGTTFQYRVNSIPGQPFDIMGWSQWVTQNASV